MKRNKFAEKYLINSLVEPCDIQVCDSQKNFESKQALTQKCLTAGRFLLRGPHQPEEHQ